MKIFSLIHSKNLLNMIGPIKKIFLISFIFLTSCNSMIDGVDKSDTQKINTVKYGTLVAAEPVKIKGEDDGLGAITGGLIGGVIGCGEGIFDDECRDAVAIVGAIGGAIIGSVVSSRIGDNNGFQYVVDIEDSDEDVSIVQSGDEQIPLGSKVTVSIGTNTRIIVSE
jgi:outer membrane lipoprotein SlyB